MATVLQKYFDGGWLKFGDHDITPKDRLDVGNRLYEDFYKAGIVDLRIPNLETPRVDGGGSKDVPDFVLDARDRFNKAFLSLTPDQTYILFNVVCLDKPIRLMRSNDYRHNIEVLKEEVCKSLDALFYHYYGQPDAPQKHKIVSMITDKAKKDFREWMRNMTK